MFVSDKNCHHKCAPVIILVFKIASVKHVPTEVWPSGEVYRRLMKWQNGTDGTVDTASSNKAPHQDSYFTGKYDSVVFSRPKEKTVPSQFTFTKSDQGGGQTDHFL